MSVQKDIHGFMASIAKGSVGLDYVPVTPEAIANQLAIQRNKVNKTLFNLMTQKKIDLVRGPNGRTIVGFRMLAEPATNGQRAPRQAGVARRRLSAPIKEMPGGLAHRRSIHTPYIEQYAAAKAKFERAKEEFGDMIEARFIENNYAEEGLMLRERLDSQEGNRAEERRELEELRREVKYLRGKRQDEMATDAIRSGAVAVSGD